MITDIAEGRLIPAPGAGAVAGVVVAGEAAGLSAFLEAGCAAAIWRRTLPASLLEWLDALPPERLPRGRLVLERGAVRAALRGLFDDARTPEGPCRERLIDDAARLAETFADLMRAPYLRLRLDAVTTNACRRFHVDAIRARLVCTYRGPGTQLGIGADGADPTRIYTMPAGAPILLRGSLWPPSPARGVLHRSPPIEGTGETRLVLVVDPVYDIEDET